jgi:very-short-patch-repair endonuclease
MVKGQTVEGRLRNARLHIYARELRHDQTDAERKFWEQLRNRRLAGFKFQRQHPIGRYIADFVCIEKQLIVESDGAQHAKRESYDAERAAFLSIKGYRVLRFWNVDVLTNMEGVIATLLRELNGGNAAAIFWACHLKLGMTLLQMLPIGEVERGGDRIDGHAVAAPPVFDGFAHDVMPPCGTATLLACVPVGYLLIGDAMLVSACCAESIEITLWRAHNRYIIVDFALFARPDSAQMIALRLKILLGRSDLVLNQHADTFAATCDAKKKVYVAFGNARQITAKSFVRCRRAIVFAFVGVFVGGELVAGVGDVEA